MLQLRKDIHISHNLREDVAIRKQTPFRNFNLLARELAELAPFLEPGHESKNLESKAPSLRIRVVKFQKIDSALFTDFLPRSKWLV